jgi:hypothetical protein
VGVISKIGRTMLPLVTDRPLRSLQRLKSGSYICDSGLMLSMSH